MIVFRIPESIGRWSFMPESATSSPRSKLAALDWCAARLPAVLEILEEARLLTSSQLVITMSSRRPADVVGEVVVSGADISNAIARVAGEWPLEQWSAVRIVGTGDVITPAGARPFPDVIGLTCHLTGITSIAVETWCDAWMKRDLRGHAQPEICVLNAPRLRKALEKIEHAIGVVGSKHGYSRYAKCTGYELTPYGDDEDSADFDDLGIDEAWIAAE
jgi:hypothetical protein